jgi:hypothetical protein
LAVSQFGSLGGQAGDLPDGSKCFCGIAQMSRKADGYDNAPMESFLHNLKIEIVHDRRYATRAQATRDIFAYMKASTTERGATPPSDASARSRWS